MLTAIVIHDQKKQLSDLAQHIHHLDAEISLPACNQFHWVQGWCTHYLRPDDQLFICIHKDQQKTVAYYSLYLKKLALGYELRFIGTGEPEHAEVCSEFQDFVVHPNYRETSLRLFGEQVRQIKHCYRICFTNILPDALCYQWLKTFKATRWYLNEQVTGKRYILPLAPDETTQITQLPQSTLRRHARRFLQQNDLTVHYCEAAHEIPDYFDALIQLHNVQWQKRHKAGAFSSRIFREFHYDFASNMLQQNKLLLFKLVHQSNVIAAFYGFYHNATLYYYQSGISAESPLPNTGIAMHLTAMQKARDQHCEYYDLMKGSDDSYKKNYVAPLQAVVSLSRTQPILAICFALKSFAIKVIRKLLAPLQK